MNFCCGGKPPARSPTYSTATAIGDQLVHKYPGSIATLSGQDAAHTIDPWLKDTVVKQLQTLSKQVVRFFARLMTLRKQEAQH
jgi:hypothetical protein